MGGKRRDVAGGRQGQADSGCCRAALAAAPSLPPLPPACRGPWLQQAPTLQSCPPLAASSRPLSREPQKPCPARRLLLTPLHLQLPAPLLPRNHPGQPLCPVSSSLSDPAPPDCHAQHTPGSTPWVTMALFDSLEWSRLPRTRRGVCLADPLLPRPVQDGRGTCAGGTARAAAGSVTREGQRGWPVRQLALQP